MIFYWILSRKKRCHTYFAFPKGTKRKDIFRYGYPFPYPRLAECCKVGAQTIGTIVEHIGVVTTPQLHHCVYNNNQTNGKA